MLLLAAGNLLGASVACPGSDSVFRVAVDSGETLSQPSRFDRLATVSSVVSGGVEFLVGDGLADEIGLDGNGVCGYAEAPPGGFFLKIGVGLLQRGDDKAYDYHIAYPVHTPFPVQFTREDGYVQAVQRGEWKEYGYRYQKRYFCSAEERSLRIEYELQNKGLKPLTFNHYNHNFFKPLHTGDIVRVNFPLPVPPRYTNMAAKPGEIRLLRQDGYWSFEFPAERSAVIRLPNGVRIEPQTPVFRFALYSAPECISPELFTRFTCQPGETIRWSCRWSFP